jgi:flavin reductase (DIM6/NTAB) family NADH-FMN oxidoreductase RutF
MPATAPSPFDGAELRRALRPLITGVTVVTTVDAGGAPRGLTANSFTSVSLDPALILVCIARSAGSFPAFAESRVFAVNILSESQVDVSRRFASRLADKFAGVDYRHGVSGAPIIAGSLAWLDCRRYDLIEAGDHIILIGEVLALGHRDAKPLGYCQGDYVLLDNLKTASPPECRAHARGAAAPSLANDTHNGGCDR